MDTWSKKLNTYFTLANSLFGAVKLTKNADSDKYKYSDYRIGFDSGLQFSWTDGSDWKNIIIFGVDNCSPVHIDDRNKNILVVVEGSTQSIDNATVTEDAKYTINCAESRKRFVLSVHFNGSNSFFYLLMQ